MKIITYPNPILEQSAREIDLAEFGVDKLIKLTGKMIKTMRRNSGIGLAAPQVNRSQRLCVISRKITADNRDLILINPLVIERAADTTSLEEGCLSVPGVQKIIDRPTWIKVRAVDFNNQPSEFEARDFLARVIQHEIDHLDGILIINY